MRDIYNNICMGNKNSKFEVNNRLFAVTLGIGLFLLGVLMTINMGYVARTLTFVFVALFGMAAYLFFLSLIADGLCLIITGHQLKVGKAVRILGFILTFLALVILTTNIATKGKVSMTGDSQFFKLYQSVYSNIQGGWYTKSYLDIIAKNPFGGGLFGYLLAGVLNQFVSLAGTYAISITALILGLGFTFMPEIILLVKIQIDKSSSREKDSKSKNKKSNSPSSMRRVNNIDIISEASNLDDEGTRTSVSSSSYNEPQNSGLSFHNNFNDSSSFRRAKFQPSDMIPINENSVQEKSVQPAELNTQFDRVQPQPVVEQPQPQPQPVVNAFVQEQPVEVPQRNEQLSIFEEENAQPINEQLVRAQPVYQEPVVANKQVQNTVEPRPKKERLDFSPLPLDLLNDYVSDDGDNENELVAQERQAAINKTFENFRIGARCVSYKVGPSVTRFNIEYDSNVSVNQVKRYVDDISVRLGGVSARFEQIVAGETYSGLEIPNAKNTVVSFKEVMEHLRTEPKHCLAIGFGKNISGDIIQADFNEFPHLLVAGTTGSGKSVFVHSILMTLIMRNSPDDLKMVLVDPKKVEMSRYKDMPHLLCPIITDAQEAKCLMDKLCEEMENRYLLFAEHGCSNIKEFNEDAPGLNLDKLPYIMIFFDEYADMVDQCKEISMPVVSIAQKARACGIHMCIATQRPSTNVVTGVIKANLPTHVALMMASSVDSMTIIGEGGAEKLIGKGDMLVQSPLVSRVGVVRLQGCFIHRQEISRVVGYLKEHYETVYDEKYLNLAQAAEAAASEYANTPEFKESAGNSEEERYQAIKEWVLTQEFMSISRIQRECAVGFNRAGRFFLRLQNEGVVGNETEGNKGCRVNSESRFSQESVVTSDEQTSFRSDD